MMNNKKLLKLIDQELIWNTDCLKEVTEMHMKWQSRLLEKKSRLLKEQEAKPIIIDEIKEE